MAHSYICLVLLDAANVLSPRLSRRNWTVRGQNHINNVIFSLIDPDGKTKLPDKVWENVSQVRSAVLNTIRDVAKPGRSFLFTNELLDGEERRRNVFMEIAAIARD